MPNKENIRKLVDELRSGNRVQGFGTLEYTDTDGVTKNCCLGVACRVAMANGVNLIAALGTTMTIRPNELVNRVKFLEPGGGSENYLPQAVEEFFGFESADPIILVDGVPRHAANVNDEQEYDESTDKYQYKNDFSVIADGFEKMYLSEDNENNG